MATFNLIPPGAYAPQTINLPSTAVPVGTARATVLLDTSFYGTDTVGPFPTLTFNIDLSQDGGVTWTTWVTASWTGPNAKGQTTTGFIVDLPQPTNTQRKVRGNAIISGVAYQTIVAGTLTLQ